ncbi:MAG: MlaD family protein [Solirubrobacteraceae bacterium]
MTSSSAAPPGPTLSSAGSPDAGRRARRRSRRRAIAVGATATAFVIALLLVLGVIGDGEGYRLHARFENAGQLVVGGRVEIGGQKVGQITDITIADDGLADVEMRIADDRFVPQRQGTRAAIRVVGQATISNRYVDLGPASEDAPALRSGAVLHRRDTTGVVDLDQVLNTLDAPVRRDVRAFIANTSQLYAGSNGPAFNAMLRKLDPALADVGGLLADLAGDREGIERLIRTGGRAAGALAARPAELERSVDGTARTLAALADEREAMAGVLRGLPGTLRAARRTLTGVASTSRDLRPALRDVPRLDPDVTEMLRRLPPTFDRAVPFFRSLTGVLPSVRRALVEMPPLQRSLTPAIDAAGKGMRDADHILEGVRFYSSDFFLGVVNGLTGVAAGAYGPYGHYIKAEFVQSPQTLLGGFLAPLIPGLTSSTGVVPGVLNVLQGQNRRCPGSGAPPAPDGSSPWNPKPGICDPTHQVSPLVNSPTAFCSSARDCYEPGGARGRGDAGAPRGEGARR